MIGAPAYYVPGHGSLDALERRDQIAEEIRNWYAGQARIIETATVATRSWLKANKESYSAEGVVRTDEGWIPSWMGEIKEPPDSPDFVERIMRENWGQDLRAHLFEHGLQRLLRFLLEAGGLFPFAETARPFLTKKVQKNSGNDQLLDALVVKWSTSPLAVVLCREAFKNHVYNRDTKGTTSEMTLADVHSLSPASPNTSPTRQGPLVFEMMVLGLLDMNVAWKIRNTAKKVSVVHYEIGIGRIANRFYRAVYHPALQEWGRRFQ